MKELAPWRTAPMLFLTTLLPAITLLQTIQIYLLSVTQTFSLNLSPPSVKTLSYSWDSCICVLLIHTSLFKPLIIFLHCSAHVNLWSLILLCIRDTYEILMHLFPFWGSYIYWICIRSFARPTDTLATALASFDGVYCQYMKHAMPISKRVAIIVQFL